MLCCKGRILRHKLEIVPYYAAPFILYLMEKKLPKRRWHSSSFGMPVVISKIVNGWCRINLTFNAHIGYIPIQDIEIIKNI